MKPLNYIQISTCLSKVFTMLSARTITAQDALCAYGRAHHTVQYFKLQTNLWNIPVIQNPYHKDQLLS